MRIEIEGVPVHVPERYPTYPDTAKQAIVRLVRWCLHHHGDSLLTVHVDRVVGAATAKPRVDGGYCTGRPGEKRPVTSAHH
jgi:hypothetical protein